MDLGKKFDSLIKKIGGLTKTSDLCGIKEYGVWRWRSTGIPPKHWGTIVAATDGAITFVELNAFKKAASKAIKAKAKTPEFSGGEDATISDG